MVDPDIGFRDDDEFGESTIALHADGDGVDAHLATSSTAVAADSAHHVAFAGDLVPYLDVTDILTDFHYFAIELVAGYERRFDDALRPASQLWMWRSVPQIPVVITRILTSPGARLGLWTFDEFEPCVGGSGFVESLHGIPHCRGCFTAAESIRAPTHDLAQLESSQSTI